MTSVATENSSKKIVLAFPAQSGEVTGLRSKEMPKLHDVCSREVVYTVLQEGPLTRLDVVERLKDSYPYQSGTVGRVLGSLINDGLISVYRESRAPALYTALQGVEESLDALREPQTARYVSWKRGEKKTGYNSPKAPRSGPVTKGRWGFKVTSRDIYKPEPHRLGKDETFENSNFDWFGGRYNSTQVQAHSTHLLVHQRPILGLTLPEHPSTAS